MWTIICISPSQTPHFNEENFITLEPLDAMFLANSTVHCELCVLSWMDFVQDWWWINWLGARALSDLGIPLCSAEVLKGLFYSASVCSVQCKLCNTKCRMS